MLRIRNTRIEVRRLSIVDPIRLLYIYYIQLRREERYERLAPIVAISYILRITTFT